MRLLALAALAALALTTMPMAAMDVPLERPSRIVIDHQYSKSTPYVGPEEVEDGCCGEDGLEIDIGVVNGYPAEFWADEATLLVYDCPMQPETCGIAKVERIQALQKELDIIVAFLRQTADQEEKVMVGILFSPNPIGGQFQRAYTTVLGSIHPKTSAAALAKN